MLSGKQKAVKTNLPEVSMMLTPAWWKLFLTTTGFFPPSCVNFCSQSPLYHQKSVVLSLVFHSCFQQFSLHCKVSVVVTDSIATTHFPAPASTRVFSNLALQRLLMREKGSPIIIQTFLPLKPCAPLSSFQIPFRTANWFPPSSC